MKDYDGRYCNETCSAECHHKATWDVERKAVQQAKAMAR